MGERESSQFERWQVDGVVIFTVREPFENGIFDELLDLLVSEEGRRIILDLSPRPIYHFSDADFGNLMGACFSVSCQEKTLRIVALHRPQHAQLDGSYFLPVFPPIYKTVEDAIQSF